MQWRAVAAAEEEAAAAAAAAAVAAAAASAAAAVAAAAAAAAAVAAVEVAAAEAAVAALGGIRERGIQYPQSPGLAPIRQMCGKVHGDLSDTIVAPIAATYAPLVGFKAVWNLFICLSI